MPDMEEFFKAISRKTGGFALETPSREGELRVKEKLQFGQGSRPARIATNCSNVSNKVERRLAGRGSVTPIDR